VPWRILELACPTNQTPTTIGAERLAGGPRLDLEHHGELVSANLHHLGILGRGLQESSMVQVRQREVGSE
jgi:hypothetical protein